MILKWNSNITDNGFLKSSRFSYNYDVVDVLQNKKIAVATAWEYEALHPDGRMNFNNNTYHVVFPKNRSGDPVWVDADDNEIMSLKKCSDEKYIKKIKKTLFRKEHEKETTCTYWEINYNNRSYRLYSVCPKGDLMIYVLYENDDIVAEILEENKAINYGYSQDVYVVDDKDAIETVVLFLYFLNIYWNWIENKMDSDSSKRIYFVNKDEYILAKHSQDFIDKIKGS